MIGTARARGTLVEAVVRLPLTGRICDPGGCPGWVVAASAGLRVGYPSLCPMLVCTGVENLTNHPRARTPSLHPVLECTGLGNTSFYPQARVHHRLSLCLVLACAAQGTTLAPRCTAEGRPSLHPMLAGAVQGRNSF